MPSRLSVFEGDMEQHPFTDDEIAQLRELLVVAEVVKKEAEYKAAVKLVLGTWKTAVVWIGGFIAAVMLLRDQIKAIWAALIGG
jgi:hypothetical protein